MLKHILIQISDSPKSTKSKTPSPPPIRKNSKDAVSKTRPRIFSRDYNQLPISCSPKSY